MRWMESLIKKSLAKLIELKETHDLCEIWRIKKYKNKMIYSAAVIWFYSTGTLLCIDFVNLHP